MKKLVLRLDLEDDKAKKKAMKTVSTLQGIDSIAMDMKQKKMTVIGTVDPVNVVSKLRKYWQADIITVGLAKEPEKKEEAKPAAAAAAAAPAPEEGKKVEGKKEEGKKEEGKEDGGKKEEGKGEEKKEEGKKAEGGGKKEGGGGKKEEGEAPKKPAMMPQPIPEHLLEMMRARQYNPYGNYPPYMAMANPYMNHPQMHHQPTYYVQSVEENPNGCTIF